MVISAPQVDDTVKAAAEFIPVISNISSQISRHTVITDHDAVLIITVSSSFQPQCSVFFIHIAAFRQKFAGFFDLICIMQCLLAEPDIKCDIKGFQIFL